MKNDVLRRILESLNEIDWDKYYKVMDEYRKRFEEAREIRRRSADWDFIEKQPEPMKTALKLLVETGDIKYVAKLSGIGIGQLEHLRFKSKIPHVVV